MRATPAASHPVRAVPRPAPRELEPASRVFGEDRGTCIDRYYIDRFLSDECGHIAGDVLEIGSRVYTRRWGGSRVRRSDVLHATEGNPEATRVGDLADAATLSPDSFDCVICTQTLCVIYDAAAAVATLHRALRPGGLLLVTVPGISQISRYDRDRWGFYWRFTSQSLARMLGVAFGSDRVRVRTYGNVATACAFLRGLCAEELDRAVLDFVDDEYDVLVAAAASKGDA